MQLMRHCFAGFIVLLPMAAHAVGDWYGIDQTTFQCVDITKAKDTPFHNPLEYIAWAHNTEDWITTVTVEPNVPIGKWIEIGAFSDDGKNTNEGAVDFIQPLGECEAVLGYEQSKGVLPHPDDLK